ncbi:hypothetical protein [Chitinophaga sp. CF118]|uniref:hypothetical protein n=1 Tax=Chitinophaga sp. CF118 TaxID=1884367 RepID=UPI0015A624A7|nr:hypothetical protein [Chitinophaga sp. CF118]
MNFSYVNNTSEKDSAVEYYYMELDGQPYTGMVYGEHPVHINTKEYDAAVVNGRFHGWMISYYPNGEVSDMQKYREGFAHGKCYRWDKEGNVKSSGLKQYGLYVSYKEWDSDGNLIENYKMPESGERYDAYMAFKKEADKKWTIKTYEDEDDQGFDGE